jgi:hypothetical protein
VLHVYEEAWNVKTVTIVKSFKKRGIINAFDGLKMMCCLKNVKIWTRQCYG